MISERRKKLQKERNKELEKEHEGEYVHVREKDRHEREKEVEKDRRERQKEVEKEFGSLLHFFILKSVINAVK